MNPTFDERDEQIKRERVEALNAVQGPRVGDYVRFADGTVRRISYDWGDGVQTSDNGSFYLGNGFCDFSGALHPAIPANTLTPTDETKPGSVWFFHHNYRAAHNGVHTSVDFRVYECSEPAPGL